MAAMSRGPVSKLRVPKKTKGGTPSSRRHHFESFSQRIAKLKIEPIRRGRSAIIDDAELDASFSYFRDALLEWRELNISDNFARFARQVAPLCDSLPQVLHHSDRILELLVEYIEKGDSHSEEPLLSLMAHFAHDLGVVFEKHFESAVRTVSQLAAKHSDVEVIEWSFTCLAWLFKYLSRLLVPDLRPVFDLMAPLLGKQHQKHFVTRFAADSLSFLVRKAGAIHYRDSSPLKLVISHITDQLKDLQGSGKDNEFQQGLMSLFAESMKGVQRGLHSSAVPILQEMLLHIYNEEYLSFHTPPLEPILSGVVTAVMHHSDAEYFSPLLEVIIASVKDKASDVQYLGLSSRLLFVVCGVRMGSRIAEWEPLLDTLSRLQEAVDGSEITALRSTQDFLPVVAVVFQHCPLDAAIPHVKILERLCKGPWEESFLSFCNLFADLGAGRFSTLVLSFFKRFVVQKAHEHVDELCIVLSGLYLKGVLLRASIQPSSLWQDAAIERLRGLSDQDSSSSDAIRLSYQCNSILDVMDTLIIPQECSQLISDHLYDALVRALEVKSLNIARSIDVLAAGNGFKYLVKHGQQSSLVNLWSSLCTASETYGHVVPFWEALLVFVETNHAALALEGQHMVPLKQGIMRCLGSPSHEMRITALGLLKILVQSTDEIRDLIVTAEIIEQTPVNLDTQRSISMRIGQIAKMYPTHASHEWISEAIPSYCFGLLHTRLASVWDDTCSALKSICETKEGEAHILRIAFEWLNQTGGEDLPARAKVDNSAPKRYATEFECTNVMQLDQIKSEHRALTEERDQRMKLRFEAEHGGRPFVNPFSRSQALRLLDNMPSIAEKRSRLLVPILLDWTSDRAVEEPEDDVTMEVEQDYRRWARKDQKAMLSLFSKFTNPKVLYRSAEVYDALLALLGNGDSEIQKAALKTILTWKEPAVAEYQENLFHLLDDARFRDEISVFLDVGTEHSLVKVEHRERLLPVLLRLLYGKVISGKRGLDIKRRAVFQALTRFEEDAIAQFLSIALGPLSGITVLRGDVLNEDLLRDEVLTPRRQIGMLNMLEDMLSTLKTTFTPFVGSIVDPLLYCLVKASRNARSPVISPHVDSEISQDVQISMLKTIRQRSLHAMTLIYESSPDFAWKPYTQAIVDELVNPRIQQFPIETAQSVSALLRLFSAWSKSRLTAPFLVDRNPEVLFKIIECLGVPHAKEDVKRFVLDEILRALVSLVSTDTDTTDDKIHKNRIVSDILQPYSSAILSQVNDLLRKSPSRELLESGVHLVAELAPHVVGSAEVRSMIDIGTFLLRQPSKRVTAATKVGLLKILHEFIPRCDTKDLEDLLDTTLDATCQLFSYFHDRQARTILCNVIEDLSACIDGLSQVADLCYDLNAFSTSRLDEPDFDRRSRAFDIINGDSALIYSLTQWKPLVYNMLYFIKDNEELSIRVNASLSLRRFLQTTTKGGEFQGFISAALLPGIHNGMREMSELVRIEFLAVLAQLVESYPEWSLVADLHVLSSGDEEASFYTNILHIQGHRRLRALRKLASHVAQLQSGNIYHIMLPLLEHYVFNKADDESANALAGETIKTISALCQGLEWPQFRSLLKRYIGYLTSKEDMQKSIIKLLAGLMDSLNQAGSVKGYVPARSGAIVQLANADNEDSSMDIDRPLLTLQRTLPQQAKLAKDLTNNILPDLTNFLRKKDESTVSLRVPVAIAVTKVLLVLPAAEIEARLPAILLDICHILRSRAQDSRDMSRSTLAEIASLAGPAYLGFILKALRTALQRGYQLHVLSFTMHSILVRLSEQLLPGELDYCLTDIVDVVMDDTFGLTGQEKDAEDYISMMKEVKSSKSFDSMDIVARCATPSHLVDLILPIKSLLSEKLSAKAVQKIDELLRRMRLGVLQNPTVKDRDVMVFSYELIQEVYKTSNSTDGAPRVDPRNRKYLINMKGALKSGSRQSSTTYTYKVTKFGLDILRTVLSKHEELQTAQNLSGFLPIIGDAMVAGQEEVQISAIRLLTVIIKAAVPELDNNCHVYVTEAVGAIKGAPSSNTEVAQASLKLITAILRERPNVEVKERHLAHLLKRILPDLDQPDRQGVTFGFLKAVMNRKIVIAEVYEVMDKLATMMVTNQTRSTRDLARSNYFHFLMNYPQAKNRFKKQMEFLLKNLRYDYVEGRQSVMEALNLMLNKVGDDVLQDELNMMFIPLVHTMANDESSDCRTMAGALVKKIFERADAQRLKIFTSDLSSWLEQDEDMSLKRLGIQCWGLYLEAVDVKSKELDFVLQQLQTVVQLCLERRGEDDWELIYYSLLVSSKLCKTFTDIALSSNKANFWAAIQSCVAYPHAWIKLTAAKLIGTYFADIATTNGESGLATIPLKSSGGLLLAEEAMIKLASAFMRNLSTPNASEESCTQSIRNLAFLTRCFAANGAMWKREEADGEDEDELDEPIPDDTNGATNGDSEPLVDEEWGGFSPSPSPEPLKPKRSNTTTLTTAVHRIISRLSGVLRRETKVMRLSSLYPKSATMTLLETLANKISISALSSSLPHLLTTLSTITDPATTIPRSTDPAFNDTYQALIDKGREIMSILQRRMGTQDYLKVMGDVQKGVKQRREDRRQKRKVEAVAAPEKWGKEKRRRNEVKKVKRKEKSAEYRGKRRGW